MNIFNKKSYFNRNVISLHFYDNYVISIWNLIINYCINYFYNFDLQINITCINKKNIIINIKLFLFASYRSISLSLFYYSLRILFFFYNFLINRWMTDVTFWISYFCYNFFNKALNNLYFSLLFKFIECIDKVLFKNWNIPFDKLNNNILNNNIFIFYIKKCKFIN